MSGPEEPAEIEVSREAASVVPLAEDRARSTTCPRCGRAVDKRGKWCPECETAFDTWVRRHATDIVWATLAGGVVLGSVGMILPLLGADWIIAATAAFAGWGTILGLYSWNAKRRRRQFLAGASLPRAYLPEPK